MRNAQMPMTMLAAALLLAGPLPAQQFESVPEAKPAQQPAATGGTRTGVINLQLAMASTQEGRKALEDLQAQFAPRQAEVQKLADELRSMEEELRTKERTLSDEARLQILRQADFKRKQLTRLQQDLQEDVEFARNEHVGRIAEKMEGVITRYAQEKSLSLILNYGDGSNTVLFAVPAVDITQDIVRLYDQAHPVEASTTQPPPRGGGQTKKPNQ